MSYFCTQFDYQGVNFDKPLDQSCFNTNICNHGRHYSLNPFTRHSNILKKGGWMNV